MHDSENTMITTQMVSDLEKVYPTGDQGKDVVVDYGYENGQVGIFGGHCTCPSGKIHPVGDHNDDCETLACIGGTPGSCYKSVGEWSNKMVKCYVDLLHTVGDLRLAQPMDYSLVMGEVVHIGTLKLSSLDFQAHVGYYEGSNEITIGEISYEIQSSLEIRDDSSVCVWANRGTDLSIGNRDPNSNYKFNEQKGWLGVTDENQVTISWKEACTNKCQICIPLGFIPSYNHGRFTQTEQ
jgi:hypothetical protein